MIKNERHFFPGSNSGRGFFGLFDQVMWFDRARRIFLLKGGPGVGKSHFMRRVAKRLQDGGLTVEYFHCSSDPDSFDAIAVKDIGLAMFDATAPHALDPIAPGVIDNIVNLGVCLDRKISDDKVEIGRLSGDIKRCFERAYRYLSAGAELKRDSADVITRAIDGDMLLAQIDVLYKKVFMENARGDASEGIGERKLFAEAITPVGVVSLLPELLCSRVISIDAPWGFCCDRVLAPLRDEALRLGFHVESYHDPLEPELLSHLSIPELSVTITSAAPDTGLIEHKLSVAPLLHSDLMTKEGATLRWNRHTYSNLEAKAIDSLKKEKQLHDELERYYTSRMDFAIWQRIFDEVMDDINDML